MGAAAVHLAFQEGRVDGLPCVVAVGGPEERHLACLLIHLYLHGGGDEVEAVGQVPFARLPVDDIDVGAAQ